MLSKLARVCPQAATPTQAKDHQMLYIGACVLSYHSLEAVVWENAPLYQQLKSRQSTYLGQYTYLALVLCIIISYIQLSQ